MSCPSARAAPAPLDSRPRHDSLPKGRFTRTRKADANLLANLLLAAIGLQLEAHAPATRVERWEVQEAREGCTVATSYSDGTSFVVSYDSYEEDGFVFLGNPAWRSVAPDREYSFVLEMPPFEPMTLRGRGTPVEGLGGFAISFRGVALITQLMEADVLVISHGRNLVGRFRLDGSYGAALELARCNRRVLDRVRPDPFVE